MQSNTSTAMHTGYVESRLSVQAILTIRSPPVEGGLHGVSMAGPSRVQALPAMNNAQYKKQS